MFGLGSTELIVVLVIVLLIFGPKKLPALARSIGESIKSFRHGKEEDKEKLEQGQNKKDANNQNDH